VRLLVITFISLFIFPLTANAVIGCKIPNKTIYTNAQGTASSTKTDHKICVHPSKYFIKGTKCPTGYSMSGSICKKTTSPQKKCAFGKKLCSNSYCVGALKACKSSNKSGLPNLSCPSGYRLSGSSCIKTTSPIKNNVKCPVSYFKAKFGPSANKFYCKTIR